MKIIFALTRHEKVSTGLSGIYAILHKKTGKAYVGSTCQTFGNRWRQHRGCLGLGKHSNTHLQNAWSKYGADAFVFVILEVVADLDTLVLREQWWLDFCLGCGAVYNLGSVAESPRRGVPLSEEHRRKIGEASRRRVYKPRPEEVRRRISHSMRGRKMSREHRQRIGAARAGPYPAFRHCKTGKLIPGGLNLSALCRRYGFVRSAMRKVIAGQISQHHGWGLV